VPVTIDSIPMFVRGGGFIFRQPVVQSTDEMPGKPLRVLMSPATESEAALYEDDGETLDYRNGQQMTRTFHQSRNGTNVTLNVSAPDGKFRPAPRALVVETWTDAAPKRVSVKIGDAAETTLPRLDADAFGKAERGWTFADGVFSAKIGDAFEKTSFTIER
jgi:hypothetical protein